MTEALPERVRRTLDELTETLAVLDPAAAARIRTARAAATGTPVVVVVGEARRGKSALVNALVGRPGLSPVAAGEATAVPLVLTHGPAPLAHVHLADGRAPLEVDPDDLARWALDGPAALPDGLPPAREISVALPAPLLGGLTLVDTPGTGGLDGRHTELAARAAENATALLVVLDAGAPATAAELELLAWAAERVETVVLALARTDAHQGWRAVAAEDAALLARHAPRLAGTPLHPVSARLAELAATAATPELAAAMTERAGVGALADVLRAQVAERAALLHHANVLRLLLGELDGARAGEELRAAALRSGGADPSGSGGADPSAALRARREELVAARRSGGRGYQLRLRALVARARLESGHEVARELRGLTTWFRARADAADRAGLARLPAELDPALALVAARVSAGLAGRVQALVGEVLGELFTPDEQRWLAAALARGTPVPVAAPPTGRRRGGSDDRLMVVAGASGGVGLGRLVVAPLVLVPGLNLLLVPLTLGLGAGAAWVVVRARAHAADRAHLRQWGTEAVAEARSGLDEAVAAQLIEVEHRLGEALDDALGRRVDAVDAELRRVEEALRVAAGERVAALRATEAQVAALRAGRARAHELLGALRAARVRVVGPGA